MLFKSILSYQKMLAVLNKNEQSTLEEVGTTTTYAKDQVVFYEAAMPFGIFILLNGKVKLYKTGDLGKNQIFQLCTPGDVFGFHAAIPDTPYPDSAATLEDSKIRFIPKDHFIRLVRQSPDLSFYLLKVLAEEFRDFINQETMLAQKSVRERVASVLVNLSDIYNLNSKDDFIPLTRADLADMCATGKESLIRELKAFKEEKLIRSDNGRDIYILNLAKLKRAAGI